MIDRGRAAIAGLLAVTVVLLSLALVPERLRVGPREAMYDQLIALLPRSHAGVDGRAIVVVDIDRDSLQAIGPWPWRRGLIAQMIDIAMARGASAVRSTSSFRA